MEGPLHGRSDTQEFEVSHPLHTPRWWTGTGICLFPPAVHYCHTATKRVWSRVNAIFDASFWKHSGIFPVIYFLLMGKTLILDLHWIINYVLFTTHISKTVSVFQLTGPAICCAIKKTIQAHKHLYSPALSSWDVNSAGDFHTSAILQRWASMSRI